ncbi:MAG: GGDEF domain-containing protein, partial [Bauldia sp.]
MYVVRFMPRLFSTEVTSDRELRSYIVRIAAVAVFVTLSADIVLHIFFFVTWTEAFRSWAVTCLLSAGIAIPVARATGKAHLGLYRAKQAVETLSRTDPLTGLPNRRALFEAAEAPNAIVLVIVDIDRFKRINDTHGHLAGDLVIRRVAETMTAELGSLGQLGRLGGEEFALLADDRSVDELSARLSRFRERV